MMLNKRARNRTETFDQMANVSLAKTLGLHRNAQMRNRLGTNSFSVLMCRKAVNQSINSSIHILLRLIAQQTNRTANRS